MVGEFNQFRGAKQCFLELLGLLAVAEEIIGQFIGVVGGGALAKHQIPVPQLGDGIGLVSGRSALLQFQCFHDLLQGQLATAVVHMRCAFTATGCGRGIKGKPGLRWLAVLFNVAGNKIMQVTELAVHLWGGGITEVIGLIENALHARAQLLRDNQVLIAAIGRSVAVGIQVPVEQFVEYW